MPAHKVPTRLSTIAEEMRRQVSEIRAVRIGDKPAFVPPTIEDWQAETKQQRDLEHAAGDVAGGSALYVPGPGNSSAASLKRCSGWRHKGHEGRAQHELPATTSHFHRSQYSADGFNSRCKDCCRDYQRYANGTWNAHIAERKAKAAP
jgi:hypothetical protein